MNKNIISLVNKKVFRNKSNILFCIIFIICFIILFGVLNFKTIYNKNLEITFNNNVDAKTIWFKTKEFERNDLTPEEHIKFITSYKYDFETIKKIPHVVDIFLQEQRVVGGHIEGEFAKGEGIIELLRANKKTLPEIVKGRKIDENDTGLIVCPTVFYPSSEVYKFKEILKLKKDDFISGDDLLNKTITMSYEKFIRDELTNKLIEEKLYKDFLVVGLYDNRDAKNAGFDCYASIKDVNEMSAEQNWFNLNIGQPQPQHPLLIVDDGKNVSSVIKELESLGYNCQIGLYVSDSLIDSIKLICNFIIIITIIVILFVTIGYIKKKSINNTFELGLLKSLGYNNKEIEIINLLDLIYLLSISIIIGFIIFFITLFVLKEIFYGILVIRWKITISITNVIISIIIMFIIPIITSYIFTKKKLKKHINYLLRGEIS